MEEREKEIKEVPLKQANKDTWPNGVRAIAKGELDAIGVDFDGNIYWHGQKIKTASKFELTPWQNTIAIIVAVATVAQAVVAVLTFLKSI